MLDTMSPVERALALAAVSGSKIALGPAFWATSRRRPNAGTWVAAALGEMVLDKLGVFPARFRPSLLLPHTLAGAWVAHKSLQDDGIDDPSVALKGAAVAAAVACALPLARMTLSKGLGMPDPLLGVAEDYLFLQLGARATGLGLGELPDVAREAVGEIGERVRPVAHSLGVGV